jgi:hypothetical protein
MINMFKIKFTHLKCSALFCYLKPLKREAYFSIINNEGVDLPQLFQMPFLLPVPELWLCAKDYLDAILCVDFKSHLRVRFLHLRVAFSCSECGLFPLSAGAAAAAANTSGPNQ